jgi:hypothetical protein
MKAAKCDHSETEGNRLHNPNDDTFQTNLTPF